jgi:hypothetical protein
MHGLFHIESELNLIFSWIATALFILKEMPNIYRIIKLKDTYSYSLVSLVLGCVVALT